jgi:hypothetical protein
MKHPFAPSHNPCVSRIAQISTTDRTAPYFHLNREL